MYPRRIRRSTRLEPRRPEASITQTVFIEGAIARERLEDSVLMEVWIVKRDDEEEIYI